MDIRLALMCGTDIPIPECQLTIHQPTIKEIAMIGEDDFFKGIHSLCLNKKMYIKDESLLADTSNFKIFITLMAEKEAVEKKIAVQQVGALFFPKLKINFTPRSMMLIGEGQNIIIDETNFDFLQEMISSICCLKSGPQDQQTFNPADEKAKEIAEKLMKSRKRVAALKGEDKSSIFSQYISSLTVGLNSMSLKDAMDLTIYQLYDLVERYSLYVNWDLDLRSRLAGGKPDSKPDNWMKNIH